MYCDDPRDRYRAPRRSRRGPEEADFDRRPHDWDRDAYGPYGPQRPAAPPQGPQRPATPPRGPQEGEWAYGPQGPQRPATPPRGPQEGEWACGPDGMGPADYDRGPQRHSTPPRDPGPARGEPRQYRPGEVVGGHRSGFYDRDPRHEDFSPPKSELPGPDGDPKPEYNGPKTRKEWLIREWQAAHEQACHEVRVEYLKERIRKSWGASIEAIAGEVDRLMFKDWELCQKKGDQHEARRKLVEELAEKILDIYTRGPGGRSSRSKGKGRK